MHRKIERRIVKNGTVYKIQFKVPQGKDWEFYDHTFYNEGDARFKMDSMNMEDEINKADWEVIE